MTIIKTGYKTTYGNIATALFSIVIISGIFLSILFSVEKPYLSIGKIVLFNSYASFIRNIHYWAAQFFLIFSLLHLYSRFKNNKNIKYKSALWMRLSIGILVIFLAMLTGFLLKGDADSRQARLILENLIKGIPLTGHLLAYSLLGKEGNYLLIYVHHIATFSIFLTIIILEHSRKIWPKASDFLMAILTTALFSYFFTAPLHNTINDTVKGPWYFVGLQEILHLLQHPSWIILFIITILILVYLIPFTKQKTSFLIRRLLLLLTGVYFVLTITGLFFRGENWRWTTPFQNNYKYNVLSDFKTTSINFSPEFNIIQAKKSPKIRGQYESCLFCHFTVKGLTKSHSSDITGCFACHGGNPFATNKKQAHRGLRLIPGNLDNAQQSCGTSHCHPDITQNINTGLMTTLSGMISVDRFVFNEQQSPDLLTNIHHLKNSAADEHLRNLCVRCHLGNKKTFTGPITETNRGGGCLACHLNYNKEKYLSWKNNKNIKDTLPISSHPKISLQITDNHCFGCHSRSGRISTNYEGWHETNLKANRLPDTGIYRLVEATRVFAKKTDDVHHKLGMECIDCHNLYELMGDGRYYSHEEQQEDVQCVDCHFSGTPKTITSNNLDEKSAIVAALRYGNITGLRFLQTGKHHHPLINTRYNNDSSFLIEKNNSKKYLIKKPTHRCEKDKAHSKVSCSACHSAWAPSCIGCHNKYDPKELSFNMIKNQKQKGGWVEYTGENNAGLPALGIKTLKKKKEIIPVIPGMIITIDKQSFSKSTHDSLLFKRLFAPAAPHTTAAKGRSCKSCHNNPVALGYGSGKLVYVINKRQGHWHFNATYSNSTFDGLPEDAWTGFLQNRTGTVSTRTNVKPFNIKEQQKILTVGACLTCHNEHSKIMQKSLINFDKVLNLRSKKCILPQW